jgi:hypothetical protein
MGVAGRGELNQLIQRVVSASEKLLTRCHDAENVLFRKTCEEKALRQQLEHERARTQTLQHAVDDIVARISSLLPESTQATSLTCDISSPLVRVEAACTC